MSVLRPLTVTAAVVVVVMLGLAACAEPTTPEIRFSLNDSPAANQLQEQVHGTSMFADRIGTAAVAVLAEQLNHDDSTMMSGYDAGDIGYSSVDQSLYVFLYDGGVLLDDGTVLIGQVASGMTRLADCRADCPIHVTVVDRTATP